MSSLLKTCSGFDLATKNIRVKDIFNLTYYTGNSNLTSVNNKLNMTEDSYSVKIKNRDNVSDHVIYDTKRGSTKEIYTNKPASEFVNATGLKTFNTRGFVLGNSKSVNNFNDNYVAMTIKKSDKFYDIIEYTGDGTVNRTVTHSLNCDIGMVSIKALDIYSNWIVRHREAIGELFGEQTHAQTSEFTQITAINNLHFKVSNNANLLGIKYIAYLHAHNSNASGNIQCGSYVGGYQEVVNTISGIGTLLIPDDVKDITITCTGGTGGSNVWYNPGKPYVPGVAEQKLIQPIYAWFYVDDYSITTAPITSIELWDSYAHTRPKQPDALPTKVSNPEDPTTSVYIEWWTGTMDNPVFYKGHYNSYLVDIGQEFIAEVVEQLYEAPTSGGDVYSGNYSKVIINDFTHVFEGGSGGIATPVTKNIVLESVINRTIKYNIASGGKLTYSYKTGGATDVTIKYSLPSDTFETVLPATGSIEIPKNIKEITVIGKGGNGSNDTYISKGQSNPYVAPVYLNPGQPYIGPTPYDPGQPYIAAVAGQTYIAAEGAVAQKGEPAYPNGLPPYVADIAGVAGTAETTSIAGWRFNLDPGQTAEEFKAAYGFPSLEFNDISGNIFEYFLAWGFYDVDGNVINDADGFPIIEFNGTPTPVNAVGGAQQLFFTSGIYIGERVLMRYYYKDPPNSLFIGYVYDDTTNTYIDTTVVFSKTSPLLTRNIGMNYSVTLPNGGSKSGGQSFSATYYPAITTPGTPGVVQVNGQGNAAYPLGLPPYVAGKAAVVGQPYIAAVVGQPYIAATSSSTGQPYVPPVIGVGDILGPSTYISINNQTFSFPGSMGFDTPVTVTDTIKLIGDNSQTLVYNTASTGYLKVSYSVPNFDTTTKPDFTPYYLLIKKITGTGDWIEIDSRRPSFNLKQNKSDVEINNEIITFKEDGFIPNSILINELDQKYIYVVIRK